MNRNRQLQKSLSPAFVWFQGGCFLSRLESWSVISPTSNSSADLKGKRLAWDYGGHAINQTWVEVMLEASGVKPADVVQVRVSNLNDGVRGVGDGKVDASITGIGIALVEEVNAMEPVRYLSLPNNRRRGGRGRKVRSLDREATPGDGR